MEPDHEAHLARVKAAFVADLDTKYRAGQDEHGGRLWEKPGMLAHAIAEIIDLVVYLYTEREQRGAEMRCPKCQEIRMVEQVRTAQTVTGVCLVCSFAWAISSLSAPSVVGPSPDAAALDGPAPLRPERTVIETV